MDSRLIAGAYSQHYRAVEKEQLDDRNKFDTIAKAKRLSQETNKRRKLQEKKRKIEGQREEKRRQEILTKRREEQNQATEKFQRSHVPAGSRHSSGRQSPRRQTGSALEDALRLIRGSPRNSRPSTGRSNSNSSTSSPGNENADPMEKAFFDQNRSNSTGRPGSGRQGGHHVHAVMMDHSLKNLTSSKSLFEQQLEQQQNLLLEQQQQALLEFNEAIRMEMNRDFTAKEIEKHQQELDGSENDDGQMQLSDSCNSLDSLEESGKNNTTESKQIVEISSKNTNIPDKDHFYLMQNKDNENQNNTTNLNYSEFHLPMNQDLTPSATFQSDLSNKNTNNTTQYNNNSDKHGSYASVPGGNVNIGNSDKSFAISGTALNLKDQKNGVSLNESKSPEKQLSLDSLAESGSSSSSLSTIKIPDAQETQSGNSFAPSSMAWVPASPMSNTSTLTDTPTPTQNDFNLSDFNPRYASAIGVSIWPGQTQIPTDQASIANKYSANNQNPYSTRGTLTSVTSTTSFPTSVPPDSLTENTLYSGVGNKTSIVKPVHSQLQSNTNNDLYNLTHQDLTYPLSQNSYSSSYLSSQSGNSSQQHAHTGNVLADMTKLPLSSMQSYQQVSSVALQRPTSTTATSQHNTTVASQQPTGPIPVPAIRTVFPKNPPHQATAQTTALSGLMTTTPLQKEIYVPTAQDLINTPDSVASATKENKRRDDDADMENEAEDAEPAPLKGILKRPALKGNNPNSNKANLGQAQPRDSLELTRLNSDKKVKKKGVHFAEILREEEEFDSNDIIRPMVITTAGVPFYKPTINRPASAKVISSQKSDIGHKISRAASAGAVRGGSSTVATNELAYQKNGLPPNPSVNFNSNTPINRPKAAAHIIMSPDHQQYKTTSATSEYGSSRPPSPSSGAAASTLHKSQFENKVTNKTVNNNFMSKVPIKGTSGGQTNGVIYNARLGITTVSGQNQQNENDSQSKIPSNLRRGSPSSTQTSKLSIQQNSNGTPTYANIQSENSVPVYDENGLRIDRTPTDEEISFLWDKVRNCLNKEEEQQAHNKSVNHKSTNNAGQAKATPTMSTKIIDGAALGFGGNTTEGLRTGQGFFYQRGEPATQNNKVKPALREQGSYLRRYGLLKQRRVQSANPNAPGPTINGPQRASSAIYGRQTNQPPENPPTPIAFTYKPSDGVSDSTAAFVMAERLAKQSLTDSHIHTGMEDAQTKQEKHNMAARNKGGHSALSMEEQRLMESLDRLNDKLKGRLKTEDLKMNKGLLCSHEKLKHSLKFTENKTNINPFCVVIEDRLNDKLKQRQVTQTKPNNILFEKGLTIHKYRVSNTTLLDAKTSINDRNNRILKMEDIAQVSNLPD